jgi:hypothetical protein
LATQAGLRKVKIVDPHGLWRTGDDGLALRADSPCINVGDTNVALEQDILGHSRGTLPDIGAYEYQNTNAVMVWSFYK